jgi:adenylate kinase family enzyme
MFNVCPKCGEYHADKIIVPEGAYAVCPSCGYQHKFIRLPLFVLTGASGVGKTTTCLSLAATVKDFVVMESDILWRDEFNQPATDYRDYRETWLRVCKNISQAGTPVILCGAGVPAQFEECVERRYFSDIHYLALVCDDEVLASRLRSRPAWRGSSDDEYIKEHVTFNRWLKDNAQNTRPPMALLDTSEIATDESVEGVERWVSHCLSGYRATYAGLDHGSAT